MTNPDEHRHAPCLHHHAACHKQSGESHCRKEEGHGGQHQCVVCGQEFG